LQKILALLDRYKLFVIPAVILALAVIGVVALTSGEHDAPFVYSIR
jgi:hypothetical protein